MLGLVRLFKSVNCIMEPKIALKRVLDLNIHNAWPALNEFADNFDFQKLCEADHYHVPYVVIFLQSRKNWLAKHGKMPESKQEKFNF